MGSYTEEFSTGKGHRPQKRACHWFIIFIALLFLFLLALESIAYIILGAWHLSVPRLQNLQNFSGAIYRRELGFGILLVVLGAFGLFVCIIGLIAIILLRLILLRIFALCLWLMMILGIIIGIIGIIFSSEFDGLMRHDKIAHPNLVEQYYYDEKFLLGMNGALTLFMSLTLIVGLAVICCLSNAVHYFTDDHIYHRTN